MGVVVLISFDLVILLISAFLFYFLQLIYRARVLYQNQFSSPSPFPSRAPDPKLDFSAHAVRCRALAFRYDDFGSLVQRFGGWFFGLIIEVGSGRRERKGEADDIITTKTHPESFEET